MQNKQQISILQARLNKCSQQNKGKFDSKIRNELIRVVEDCRYKINLVVDNLNKSNIKEERLIQLLNDLGKVGLAIHFTKLSK